MHRVRRYMTLCFALIVTVGMFSLTVAQTAKIPFHTDPYVWSSALHRGEAAATVLAEAHTVEAPDAAWLRVKFSDTNLGLGSFLTIRSLQDDAVQRLDGSRLAEWQNHTAYFNGDAVEIQLHVAPNDEDVFFQIEEIVVGEWVEGTPQPFSQCGPTDDRVPSNHPASGRILSIGCTGWIVSNGLHVTAGHCSGGSATVLQFNVPPSSPSGTINNPPPEDQYSIDPGSKVFVNGGIGNDWGVFSVFDNSNTGLQPIDAQGASFNVKQDLGPADIRITGFGVDFNDPTRNQTQQTHVGPNASSSGTTMRYRTDTEGGNSGSPVIDDDTGEAVGVHTHGGCSIGGGGNNSGTSTFNSAFWAALSPPAPSDEYKFNCGGPSFTTSGGVTFDADQAFSSGGAGYIGGNAFNTGEPIGGTTDDALYNVLRGIGENGFSYDFTLASSGDFDVVLHFAAPAFGSDNAVIDVSAEGSVVFNNLDIESEVGAFQATTKSFTVNVSDGVLNLDFDVVNKAAFVSAIEVAPAATAPGLAKGSPSNENAVSGMPETFELYQNHPNPFNPTTNIRFNVPADMNVTLRVFNMVGEEVRTLVDGFRSAGSHEVQWNSRLDSGSLAPSGVYVYRLEGEGIAQVRKMILLK